MHKISCTRQNIKNIITMKIAVFCSANAHIDSDYFHLTEEMGKWMAEQGHDLVFGGCNIGLMRLRKAVVWQQKRQDCGEMR